MTTNAKLFSILAYFPLLWLVGMFVEPEKNDPFVRFHVNQGIILTIAGAIISVVSEIFFLLGILGIFTFVCFILGIINVCNGQTRPLPFIGGFVLYK